MKCFGRPSRRVVTATFLLSMLIGWHVDAIGAELNLTWLDSSTDEAGFAIERSTGTTGAFAEITTTGPGVTAYTDASVAAATTYCYRVRAFNAVAYSAYSNSACGTLAQFFGLSVVKFGLGNGTVTSTPAGINCGTSCSGSYANGTAVTLTATPATGSIFTGWSGGGCSGTGTCTVTVAAETTVTATFTSQATSDTTPPTAPTGLTAAPISSSQIDLSWGASTDNTGVTGYRVERCQGAGCTSFGQLATPTGTSFSDTGLIATTTYGYRVWATDAAGNLGAYSNVASATTLTIPPATGLVAAYAFDETSGTTAADSSGNGNTGLLINGPIFAPGKNGNAVSLDGVNNYVDLGTPPALQITGSLTLSAWINSSSFPVDDAAVVSQRGTIGYQLDTTIDTGPRTIGFKLTNSSGSNMLRYGATAMQLNQWYHIAGVYDAASQTMNVYLNGQLNNGTLVGTITSSQQNSGLDTVIGRRSGLTGFEFAGEIDDVRIYNRALSQAEIQTDMDTPLGPGAPDTMPPTSPTGLTATAMIPAQINLGWSAATDNVGVTGYRVERCQGAGCTSFVQVATPTGTSFSDTGLAAATTYSYRVRAADAAGNLSGYSNIASAALPSFTLTVSKAGAGSGTVTSTPTGISCGTTCSWGYPSGTAVTLSAAPATGSTFTGWSGGGCSGSGSCTVTVTAATTVTATFALQPVTLTVSKAGTGSGTVTSTPTGISCGTTCSWSYASGTAVTLAATPATGSAFTGWSGGCTGTGACSVTLTAAITVTATFALQPVASPPPGDTATTLTIGAPTVTYNTNAVVTVSVSAAAGTPTGVVSLVVDNGTPLTATLSNGQAQFILTSPSVGDHTLQASYAAQGGFAASSATASLHVNGSGVYFSSATYNVNAGSTTTTSTVLRSGSTRANITSGSTTTTITVLRSGSTKGTITVNYATSDGTARAGVDYVATSGTLTFKSGVTKNTFQVPVLGSVLTAPKTVNLTLSNPSSGSALGTPRSALLTLLSAPPGGTGLVAAYAFNETSGTTASDSSGNGNTGLLTNGPVFAPGKNGNAVSLDGVNDYVNIGTPTALQITGSMTISAWINSTAFPVDDAAVVSKRGRSNNGYQLDTTVDTGPRTIGFKLTNSSGSSTLRYGATAMQLNQWYHIAGVYDAASRTMNVYLNGQLNNGTLIGTITSSQQNSALNTVIGRRSGLTGFEFAGKIDDVRIYNRALTPTEIQQDMNTPL